LWAGTPKAEVQRKFKYARNELFQKHFNEIKKLNVFNTMQMAMFLFDLDDFHPNQISPENYETALAWMKEPKTINRE
jgi:hypothetical protein